MNAKELRSLGIKKIMENDYLGGLECYRQALRLSPDDYELYWSYFTWLEDVMNEIPAYVGDAILCMENMLKIIERDNLEDRRKNLHFRYMDLATTYFRNRDFEKALSAARKSIKLGCERDECKILEAYGLKLTNQDKENKYQTLCENAVASFKKRLCNNKVVSEASIEQIEALKNAVDYELPTELLIYLKKIRLDQTRKWKGKVLMSYEDMLQENSSSSLSKMGFFTIAKVRKGDSMCIDLIDNAHPVFQCSGQIIGEDGITFPRNKTVHLELNYENVKKVSFLSELNFVFFLSNLEDGYVNLKDTKEMERQYFYNKFLEETGFKCLDIQISNKKNELNQKEKDKIEKTGIVYEAQTNVELDKNVIEGYENIIDLFDLDPNTTDLLKKCVCNPHDFYNNNIVKYEERNVEEDDGEQELIWIGIVDTLIEKEKMFEFDWKVELDTFLYGMEILCARMELTINKELLDENKDIRVWSRILSDQFKEKGYVVAAMDIDSDSYCTIVVPVDKFGKLVLEAKKTGHRIDLAQNM